MNTLFKTLLVAGTASVGFSSLGFADSSMQDNVQNILPVKGSQTWRVYCQGNGKVLTLGNEELGQSIYEGSLCKDPENQGGACSGEPITDEAFFALFSPGERAQELAESVIQHQVRAWDANTGTGPWEELIVPQKKQAYFYYHQVGGVSRTESEKDVSQIKVIATLEAGDKYITIQNQSYTQYGQENRVGTKCLLADGGKLECSHYQYLYRIDRYQNSSSATYYKGDLKLNDQKIVFSGFMTDSCLNLKATTLNKKEGKETLSQVLVDF